MAAADDSVAAFVVLLVGREGITCIVFWFGTFPSLGGDIIEVAVSLFSFIGDDASEVVAGLFILQPKIQNGFYFI